MAEEDKAGNIKATEAVEEAPVETAPLTRKRTRDDFEEGQNGSNDDEAKPQERKIAAIKRRKDVTEKDLEENKTEKKDDEVHTKEEVKDSESKDEVVNTDNKEVKADPVEVTKEDAKETKEEEKPKEKTVQESKEEVKEELKEGSNIEAKDEKSEKPEEKKKDEAPKFVFGSTTPFGANAFSLLNKNKNVFDSSNASKETSKSPSTTTTTTSSSSSSTTTSVFGSNSKFGNAFQSAVTKKSIFDKTPEEATKEKEEIAKSRETTPSTSGNLYKQVDLEKKEIKSGEEDEDHVFTCRAKLYALDLKNVKEGWKERGIGNVHVNRAKEVGKTARIIMRSIGLLKVILNIPLVEGLDIVKGMPSSLSSEKFIRITIVENNNPIQYALKTGNSETTTSLYDAIVDLIPKSV